MTRWLLLLSILIKNCEIILVFRVSAALIERNVKQKSVFWFLVKASSFPLYRTGRTNFLYKSRGSLFIIVEKNSIKEELKAEIELSVSAISVCYVKTPNQSRYGMELFQSRCNLFGRSTNLVGTDVTLINGDLFV